MSDPPTPILLKVPVCPKCGQALMETKEKEISCPHCGAKFSQKDVEYRYVWTDNHAP